MSKRGNALYLRDMYEAIQKIRKYVRGLSFEEFKKDEKTIDAVIRNVEILGEAASHVDATTRKQEKAIPWNQMKGMRNKVAHEYFGVDQEILWYTIQEDLPEVQKVLKEVVSRERREE